MSEVEQQAAAATTPAEVPVVIDMPKGAPEPYAGEEVFTHEAAKKSRKKGFKSRRCRVLYVKKNPYYGLIAGTQPIEFMWWASNRGVESGCHRDSSPMMNVVWALTMASAENLFYVIMDEKRWVESAPKPRRCKIEQLISAKTVSMLKVAPMNETFRATLMSELEQMPPKEAQTYDQIKDWVEYNFPKEVAMPEPVPVGSLTVAAVNFAHTERGRADYTRRGTFRGTLVIPGERILELANSAQNATQLKTHLDLTLREMAAEQHIQYVAAQTTNHEIRDYVETQLTYSPISYNNAVGLLANHAPPPVLARLGIAPGPNNPYVPRRPVEPEPTDPWDEDEYDRPPEEE